MAVPATYAALQTELADWLNRDDMTTQIVNFIGYAEARFNRELFVPEREANSTLTASAETVAMPADFWSLRSAYLNSAPRRTLRPISLGDLRDTYALTDTGRPEDYAIVGSTMYLGPIPNASYSIVVNYYTSVPALASNSSNWLLTAHPDLYVNAALTYAYRLLRDTEGMAIHEGITAQEIDRLNKLAGKKRHGASPIARRGLVASVSRVFRA